MKNINIYSERYLSLFKEEIEDILIDLQNSIENYLEDYDDEHINDIFRNFYRIDEVLNVYNYKRDLPNLKKFIHNLNHFGTFSKEDQEDIIENVLDDIENFRKDIKKLSLQTIKKRMNHKVKEEEKSRKSKKVIIKFDFKGDTIESFKINDLKEIMNRYGKLEDFKINNENIPSIEDLKIKELNIKLEAVIITENKERLISNIMKIIKKNYFEISDFESDNEKKVVKKPLKIKSLYNENENNKIIEKIKVDPSRLDEIMTKIGKLVTMHSNLYKFLDKLQGIENENFNELISKLQYLTNNLKNDVLDIKMISLKNTFLNLKQIARQIARQSNKKIDFEYVGGHLKVDEAVLEKITNPLIHMIRNAADHGIETEEERVKKGKSKVGKIEIIAKIENRKVILEVYDDGQGLDRQRIEQKAIEKGIINPGHKLTESEIFALIFRPKFSTAKELTMISGRGVGMDVVLSNIKKLHGNIDIQSKKDKYTRFIMELPLSLTIIESILVKVGKKIYILPVYLIERVLEVEKRDIVESDDKEILNFYGEKVPLLRLYERFKDKSAIKNIEDATVIITNGNKKIAIMVDEIIDEREIVIRDIKFSNKNAFTGATILNTGEIALVLDIHNLHNIYNL
ncbi:MAG: chemotaxis protein CheA [Fusobacteriota bacterium]